RRRSPRVLRPRSSQAVLRCAGTFRQHDRRAVHRPPPPPGPQGRRRLDRHLPIHDRQGARGHHRPLSRAEAAHRDARGRDLAGIHRAADRAGHELPAQRPPQDRAMKPQRVLALVHKGLEPPDEKVAKATAETAEWRMEYDVVRTLKVLGNEISVSGLPADLTPIKKTMDEFKPTITFNLMEAFDDIIVFDQNVVSYLELLKVPYTGCNPRGLTLSRDKALAKKLM